MTIEIEPQRLVGRSCGPGGRSARNHQTMAGFVQAWPARAAADRQPADRRAVRRHDVRSRTRRRPSSIRSGRSRSSPRSRPRSRHCRPRPPSILNKIANLPLEQLVSQPEQDGRRRGDIVNSPSCQRAASCRPALDSCSRPSAGSTPLPARCWPACNDRRRVRRPPRSSRPRQRSPRSSARSAPTRR